MFTCWSNYDLYGQRILQKMLMVGGGTEVLKPQTIMLQSHFFVALFIDEIGESLCSGNLLLFWILIRTNGTAIAMINYFKKINEFL